MKHILYPLIGVVMVSGGGLVYFNLSNKKSEELPKSKNYKEIAEKVNKSLGAGWWGATLPEPNDSWWYGNRELTSDAEEKVGFVNPIPKEHRQDAYSFAEYCYKVVPNYTTYPTNDATLKDCLKPLTANQENN